MNLEKNNLKIIEERSLVLEWSHDHENVIYLVRQFARKAGFSIAEEVLIASAASELSTNILRYAQTGKIKIFILWNPDLNCNGLKIIAIDQGPGIKDIDQAIKENYSSVDGSLGLGLSSVKRIMDEFKIKSELGKGTIVEIVKWVQNEKNYLFDKN